MAKSGATKKKPLDRSNQLYMRKIVKAHKTAARGPVVRELDLMLTYLLKETNGCMAAIMGSYDKTSETVKAKVAQSAFQMLLSGTLRDSVCDAGAEAVTSFVAANKEKAAAKTTKSVEVTAA
jgi:hypothetical protein